MPEDDHSREDGGAEELLRRALLDDSSSVAVSLRVDGLPLSEALTVIFHGRRDLGTLQTYVTWGSRGAGTTVAAGDLLRVPCDLDLADAEDRDEAERLYVEQATALRDALVGADVVLDVWREPLSELAGSGVAVDHSVELSVRLPAPRLLPTALVAPESQLVVTPVCGARTLADGRPPMGIALRAAGPRRGSIRWPTIPSAACRTSSSWPPSTRSRWPSASITRRPRCERFLELSGDGVALGAGPRPARYRLAPGPRSPATVRADAPRHRDLADRRRGRRVPGVSALLARAFSVDGAEDAADHALVRPRPAATGGSGVRDRRMPAQRRVPGARERAKPPALRRPGSVSIIQLAAVDGVLARRDARARRGWRGWSVSSLPLVQCVRVRHAGNVL